MATNQTLADENDEFNTAFAEPEAERTEMSEDEAFGLDPNPEDHMVEDGAVEDSQAGEGGDAPAVTIAIEPEPAAEPAMDPKDEQRAKSWEGRLKAREAELAAREEALKSREAPMAEPAGDEPGEDVAHEAAEPAVTEAIEDAVEQIESGELTPEQALKALSEDFGEDFGRMLDVLVTAKAKEIAGQVADEKVGNVNGTVQSLIAGITDDKQRAHHEAIAEAHPDFMEVADSDAMKTYLDALPEDQRTKAEGVIASGSARQIVKLLDAVKASSAPAQEEPVADTSAMDAAEGVRSKGLRIPEKPGESQDYADAWAQF